MSGRFKAIKGAKDLLPSETVRWRALESTIHDFMARWGYGEIRTPVFEQTELFARSVGEESEIVSKQMYTFLDQGENSLTLKPELTAPAMRAYIQHDLSRSGALTKLYYIDSLFRQERPQAGRLRQFHQYGVEAIGSPHPEQDADVIALAYKLLEELNIKNMTLLISSIGSEECRTRYRDALTDYLSPFRNDLSETSQKRLQTNPLRILDTKDPEERGILQDAPHLLDYLDGDDRKHYDGVKKYLTDLDIPYVEAPILVRGLDYYSRTTFEITHPGLGAQNALCGGGRYDNLIEDLGGQPTPAVGFAAGIERILLVLEEGQTAPINGGIAVYAVAASDEARRDIFRLVRDLREERIRAEFDTLRRSLKAQMREADRMNCTHAVIIGEDELKEDRVLVKNLSTGKQADVKTERLVSHLRNGD
ncbi:MAG: histidine--tRNA ligase [Candidatus Neomarinimicrobiota bacterium]